MRSIDKRIQSGLVLFWALYFSIVLLSNSADALKALRLLPTNWPFVSGNYGLIDKVVSIYSSPTWLAGVLFAGVILWEAVGTVLFWKAFVSTRQQARDPKAAISRALGVTIGLWAAFIVADEVFLTYTLGNLSATHFNLLLAELASFILIRLLE